MDTTKHQARFNEALEKYNKRVQLVQERGRQGVYGPEGVKQEIEKAKAEYDQVVQAARQEAAGELERERKAVTEKLTARRVAAAKAERDLLGPEISFRLIEKRLEGMDALGLRQAVESARDPWERKVIAAVASTHMPRLESQLTSNDVNAIHEVSQLRLLVSEPADIELATLEDQSLQLDRAEREIGRLDPIGHEQDLRQRYNLG